MKKLLALMLVLVMMLTLVACPEPPVPTTPSSSSSSTGGEGKPDAKFDLEYAEGTVLRMATGYNNKKTGLFFDASQFTADEPSITLADGKEYRAGDLKPTWVEVQNRLGMVFENKYGGRSAKEEFNAWIATMDQIDMLSGNASQLNEAGVAGELINIADYLDHMPNFKAYLEANPIVRLSITSDTSGAIYFSPYFDGVNDIERMPLMRTDWVVKLLDGEGEFTASASNNLAETVYTPYMPTSGKVSVDVVKLDKSGVETITKDYDKSGNIVAKMNAAGTLDGVAAVNMLRKYIDEAYNGYYGTQRSNLFVGQNAAWDADELVALLRCVVANPQTLNGTDSVEGIFSREDDNNQRRVDMFRFAGTLFGVRGLESRQDYLYVDENGDLRDARQEEATYVALERMNALVQEGLISDSFINGSDTDTKTMLKDDAGFMHYDYNQTQTIHNEQNVDNPVLSANEKYMAVMVPVARWNDGNGEVFMRFTESWRSVKTDGWAISLAGVAGNTDKLHAALAIIDYAYSKEGQILMSYGPDDFIAKNADGSLKTFTFNGEQWPQISDATYEELWEKAGGNYTNYARKYLGSTLSFAKSQSFEYQCTQTVGKEGAGNISTAIGFGIIKHPELALATESWWTSVPTVLPTTKTENDMIATYTELGSKGKFSSSKGGENLFIEIIRHGYSDLGEGLSSRAEVLNTVSTTWNGANYLELKNDAWLRLQSFYANLGK